MDTMKKRLSAALPLAFAGLFLSGPAAAVVLTVEVGTFFAPEAGLGQSAEGTQKIGITYGPGTGPALTAVQIFLGNGAVLDFDGSSGDPDGSGTNTDDPALFPASSFSDLTSIGGGPITFQGLNHSPPPDEQVIGPWEEFIVGFGSALGSFDPGEQIILRADLDPAGAAEGVQGFGNPITDNDGDPDTNAENDYLNGYVVAGFDDGGGGLLVSAVTPFSLFWTSGAGTPNNDICNITQVHCAFAFIDVPGSVDPDPDIPPINGIPEPAGLALMGIGLLGLFGAHKRRAGNSGLRYS